MNVNSYARDHWQSALSLLTWRTGTLRWGDTAMHRWPIVLGLIAGLAAVYAGFAAGSDAIEQWRLAARWTARVGFPIFLLAYSASSLGRMWPGGWRRALWRDRRWWGLGFAVSHTIHLYALVTYLQISGEQRPLPVLLIGGGAYVMLYLMALTSNEAAMRALGKNWRRLHTLGIHWLWFVYAISYFGRIGEARDLAWSSLAFTLSAAALGLRIAVWLKGRRARTG